MESDQEQIRQLAYQFWEAGGRRPDTQMENWLHAEQRLREMQQGGDAASSTDSDETEPDASSEPDSPATRLIDQMFTKKC